MSKKPNSSFLNENDKVSSDKSITSSTDKDSLFFGNCIAISPDSQQIVTFNQETHEFKLYKTDDLSSSKRIFTLECGVNDKNLCWSIAISNCVDDDGNERLIALSCFDARKFRHDEMNSDDENDLDFGDNANNQCVDDENDLDFCDEVNNQYDDYESDLNYSDDESDFEYRDDKGDLKYDDCLQPQTWVISTKDKSEIYTSLESIGGVIRFLDSDYIDVDNDESDSDDSDDSNDSYQPLLKLKSKKKTVVIIIVNELGIFKETIKKRELRFFLRSSKIQRFELPKQLSIRLSHDHWQNSFELLHTSIIKNHLIVYSFKNRQQIIEMYSLITGDLEMLFKRHEPSVAPDIIHGSPIFAISQNEKILAFCRGTTSITLYFMENGLEITTKQLEGQRGIYKIIAINFIDDDSKLLIVLEEKEDRQRENSKHQIFVVWDLFTTFENSIRQIDYSEPLKPLKMDVTHILMNSHGNMFAVRDGVEIFSVLDHLDVASIRNPSKKAITEIDITTKDNVSHAIYNIDGKRFDELAKNRIIMNNVEPWQPNKNYFRISVYLDSTESTQLIISSNTIQVWKYRNNNTMEKRDKRRDRVLEYIWARKKAIEIQELKIGEQEFVLKVLIPSTKHFTPPKSIMIHWPNNVNVLEGACRALYVLREKEHIVTGHENVNKIKYLVECTQRLVRKYITKYGIFRLTSIRYPIMRYLIASHQESLIKLILNKKINRKNIWKYRNNNTMEKRDKRRDRVLEYIWARKKAIEIQELKIGEQEFVLKVLIPSTKHFTPPKSIMIHWPNNVNVLEGACRALYVLREKEHIVTGHENVNKIKYLVECTQRLVRKYITKYGIFRLTSIRYPIMRYLIASHQESLIKLILNKKINRKNSNIYIPRLYKWVDDNNRSTTEISKSDLHHAILCIQKRGGSTVILKYLIDYYTDNVKEYNNHGWLFTVSKAIPLLYDHNLREFVQYLFKKPCFGITEAYTPPLHINHYDQKKGNNAPVIHSLVVKPRLASKLHNTLWVFFENLLTRSEASHNDRKVYMVPLPDFTVYPDPKDLEDHSENYSKYFWFLFSLFRISLWPRRKVINNTKKMSPFLRVIHEEEGYEIYQTPAIMAVLDFKWPATQIVQLKREGLSKYMNIHNLFDLAAVFLPMADNIASFLYDHQVLVLHYSVFNSVLAFTALVMWLELLLLMRYFEGPGRFIYIIQSILKTIWPFFAFMLIAIFAFGHAMFILLNYADDLQIPTYKINDTSNSDLYSNITIYQDVDKSSRLDNYYSHFISSVEAVFFWTNGRWDQLDQWDSYAVDVMAILGSITLVGTFDKANKAGHTVAHRHRAELIAEYEALEKAFASKRGNPRYIYYIPDPDVIDTWLDETKKDEEQKLRIMGENLAELTDSTDFNYSDDDDDNDDDNQDNSSYSKRHQHIQNESFSSNVDIESIFTEYEDKITFTDEEIFVLKVTFSKSKKKPNSKLSSNDPDPATNIDDQSLIQERFNNLETRFNNLETRLEQNLKTILETLNNLNKDV
ncbi:hypothetical protein Glove_139g241 [Diversispora epigaea]|uniref:Ion transport domain-containing protein n=1 Tax=Diversispora epigaea TaxID=1348612 RepID=A0A397IVG6_9GLOM|nr:hypothetical protein Glove_139g241 [Diversispora epigaea]